jgi:hypothetical protein
MLDVTTVDLATSIPWIWSSWMVLFPNYFAALYDFPVVLTLNETVGSLWFVLVDPFDSCVWN